MSVTGVLLAYKRQIINWSDGSFHSQAVVGTQRVPLEQLLAGSIADAGTNTHRNYRPLRLHISGSLRLRP